MGNQVESSYLVLLFLGFPLASSLAISKVMTLARLSDQSLASFEVVSKEHHGSLNFVIKLPRVDGISSVQGAQ